MAKRKEFEFRKHKYLLLCVGLLAITLIIDEVIFSDRKRRVEPQETITANVKAQLSILDKEVKSVENRAIVDLSRLFNRLEVSDEFPIFIYEEGEIIYWSTNRFVPKYGTLEGLFHYRYLEIGNDKFIVKKTTINSAQNRIVEIYGFLPLKSDVPITAYFASTGLNEKIFGKSNYSLSADKNQPENNQIYTQQGIYLFSFAGTDLMKIDYPNYAAFIILMFALCIFFYVRAAFFYSALLNNKGKPMLALGLLTLMLFTLRALMIRFQLPYSVRAFDLFDPFHFAANYSEPSLGDLLLNQICLLVIVVYGFLHFHDRNGSTKYDWKFFALLTLSVFSFYYLTFELNSLLSNSQWKLDIAKDNSLSIYKLINYFVIFVQGVMFFLLTQLAATRLTYLNNKLPIYVGLAFALLASVVIGSVFKEQMFAYLIIYIIYLVLIVRLKFPFEIKRLSYNTFLYFFTASFAVALVSTLVLAEDIKKVDRQDKVSIATELLTNKDVTAEYLLGEAKKKIEKDILIQANISNLFSPKQLIRQRIRRSYLGEYFDKYDIEIMLFNGSGRPINNTETNEYASFSMFSQDEYRTDQEGVYFLNFRFPAISNHYYVFMDIERYETVVGRIIIHLVKKEQLNNSILPRLLFDETSNVADNGHFNYALFQNDEIASSVGDFNYERDFPRKWKDDPDLFGKGILVSGYTHLAVKGRDASEYFIISSPRYPTRFVITNFSLFFLFIVGMIILVFLASALFYNLRKRTVTITAKVQILLNFAFFLPLIIVSIVVLRLVNETVRRNIEENYLDVAESAGSNLTITLKEFLDSQSENNETLENRVGEISQYSRADINLFNDKGVLVATNQRMLFENQVLSTFVNPRAMAEIVENRSSERLYTERVGALEYQSTYVGIRSQNNELLGVLSMPFFESQTQLKRQQTDIISNILNSFTFIFIVFVLLSFLASKIITYPFTYLTKRIKATTFSNINEPLEWDAEDEIGLMVREYNRMLVNLERSKKELAMSEKESAWREMAQQVAHEIKNPLTPMKLKLQHLKRLLTEGKGLNQDFSKPIDSILDQVESLSDIATSFSSFAKMPVPRSERLDLADSLRKVVALFKADNEVEIKSNIPRNPVWIEGDANLLGRIFNNLILNALQAMPEGRNPVLEISLEETHSKAIISVKDNGSGIPDEIKDKIFIPKFSTKVEGSGIGLAIAKRGVEHAGGSIWFETETGEGATFFLEFPLTD
ncbi:ATP-binding protein [Roseivirga echinicomitans]